jgi:pSer/pThr/pTyr-binding forkhead associated (FHA) protein
MLGQLVVIAGPDEGRSFDLDEGQTLVLGRGEKTDTRLKDPQVSRTHCQVEIKGGEVRLVDSGSRSGTMVNGKKVDHYSLKPGDVIQLGGTRLEWRSAHPAEASTVMVDAATGPRPTGEAKGQLVELIGQTLSYFGIEELLARGQSGIVFKASDTREKRSVALKVLWPEFTTNDEEMQRFIRAMKTVLPLKHPNLVRLYGAGKTGGYCWMAMEYVEGESLTQVIHRIGAAGMLDWRNALRVAIHIARALEFAEDQQILHRNIKPSNILICKADQVTKLGDLMLAKALEGTLAEQITRQGQLVGDIAYMSPERTRGNTGVVDCRSDIYSLGATVYALLTGRPPFEGDSLADSIQKIRQGDPVKPKKYQLAIPDAFEGSVLKMLAKRPGDRYQGARDLVTELDRVAQFQGLTI